MLEETQAANLASDVSAQIAAGLRSLGVRPGGILLVHAGLRSLGPLPGGPETVVSGLLAALGDAGTLLMPALSYQHVTREHPVFHRLQTPSNVGTLPEYFRTRPGTQRSMHPTHSVSATGALADALLRDHWRDDTPVGAHSPFLRLAEAGGQILMLGCGLRPSTSMHGVEELAEPPYLYGGEIQYRLIDADGAEREKVYRRHGFAGWAQRYDRIAGVLPEGSGLRVSSVLAARAHLIEAPALWEAALAALRQNPLYFVDRVEA